MLGAERAYNVVVVVVVVVVVYRMSLDHIKEQVAKFATMDANKDGVVTLQEFADFYRLPLSIPVKELFAVYDRVSVTEKRQIFQIGNPITPGSML